MSYLILGLCLNFYLVGQPMDSTIYKRYFPYSELIRDYKIENLQQMEESNEIFIRIWSSYKNETGFYSFEKNQKMLTVKKFDIKNDWFHNSLAFLGLYKPSPEILNCDSALIKEKYDKLIALNVLTLKDESELDFWNGAIHGLLIDVEIYKNGVYRHYSYLNPQAFDLPETKKMWKIFNIVYKEIKKICESKL